MKRNFFLVSLIICGYFFTGCQQNQNNATVQPSDNVAQTNASSGESIPDERKQIKKDPVASYKEKADDALNDWYFSVRLFETKKTFDYLLKMQFEEIRGEDTVRLPNLGFEPKPELRKGKDKYSCIIGFLDQQHNFREYKLVSVKNGNELKLTTLNRYSVVPSSK